MEKTMYSDTGYHIGVFFSKSTLRKLRFIFIFDEALI